jgi:hypothetical protein
MTVKELIENLNKYDENVNVVSGYISKKGTWNHMDLEIKETHPIGDRDSEDVLLLWIGCIED